MSQASESPKTFTATEALIAFRRVKLTAASGTAVEYADSGEQAIGFTLEPAAINTHVAIALIGTATRKVTAEEAFAAAATLYGAADGKVKDTSAGSAQGIALEAATADGDIVEMAPFNVLSTTAATVSIADAGTFTDETTVEAALQEIYQHQQSAQKCVPVPLGAITLEDGTALTKQATTVTGYAQLASKEIVIMIPVDAGSGEDAMGFSTTLPPDLDDSADVVVHVLVGKDADNDALTLDCEVFPSTAGDVANADIQDTAATAIVAAVTELTFTCGADGVLAAPCTLAVVLTQGGTNDGDKVYIYGVWIEYTAQTLTS